MGIGDLLRQFKRGKLGPAPRVPLIRVPEPRSRATVVQLEDEGQFRAVVEEGERIRRANPGIWQRQRVRVVFRVTDCVTCGAFLCHAPRRPAEPGGVPTVPNHWREVEEFWSGEWRHDLPLGGVPRPTRPEMIAAALRHGARFCDAIVQGDF